MAAIILISASLELEEMMKQVLGKKETVVERMEQYQLDQLRNRSCDLVALDFTTQMQNEGRYKIVFEIKCRTKAPVLSILEDSSTRAKLILLNFGVDDYMERQELEEGFLLKSEQLLRMKRIMEQMEQRKNNTKGS